MVALEFRPEVLGIETTHLRGLTDVSLRGELDIATTPVLHEHLAELVNQRWVDLALDLDELRFMDCVGLSLLITTRWRVQHMGGSLVVRHPNKSTLKLFEAAGFTEILMGAGYSRIHSPGMWGWAAHPIQQFTQMWHADQGCAVRGCEKMPMNFPPSRSCKGHTSRLTRFDWASPSDGH